MGVAVRAIRGATRLNQDAAEEMALAVVELLAQMIDGNDLEQESIISVLFTATPDLRCAFPAAAARGMGLTDVPLMCAQEIDVAGAMPGVIRVMMHAETDRPKSAIWHPYLRGTDALRSDPEPAQ